MRLMFALVFLLSSAFAQTISPFLIGENAWMETNGGQIDQLWGQMKSAHYSFIRIGGAEALVDNETISFDLKLIDSIRAIGAEPLTGY